MTVEGLTTTIRDGAPVFVPKEYTYYSSDTYTKAEAKAEAELRNQTGWPFDRNGNPVRKRHYSIIAIDKLESTS
jgi:hypothetical protein